MFVPPLSKRQRRQSFIHRRQKHRVSKRERERGRAKSTKTSSGVLTTTTRVYSVLERICYVYIYIYLSNCLKVVWKLSVPEYILTLKIDSTALVLPQYERGTLIP